MQLFSYLIIVVLGAIWVVALTGQRILTTAAFLLVFAYSVAHLLPYNGADQDTVLLFIYAFSAIFFITNTLGILKNKSGIEADLGTAAANGLYLLIWIMMAVSAEWQSLIISAWMVVFAGGAFVTFRITGRLEPFYTYAGIGIAMLAAATSAELEGATLTIAYTIEAAAIVFVVWAILKNAVSAEKMSLLLIAPAILSLQNMAAPEWQKGIIHEHFFVLLILGLTLFVIGAFFWQVRKQLQITEKPEFNSSLMVGGTVYGYILLWLSLHALLKNDDTAVMLSLLCYTIIGLATYIYGRVNSHPVLSVYGGILLGFVVGRLLLVDVWQMELSGRIVTFFIIGTLLILTAFIGRKKKEIIYPPTNL